MVNAFFSDLLSTISERGRALLRLGSLDDKRDASGLIELCEALLSGRGEASGTALAREVLDRYHHLDPRERLAFSKRWHGITAPTLKGLRKPSRPGARSQMTMTPATCTTPPSRGDRN